MNQLLNFQYFKKVSRGIRLPDVLITNDDGVHSLGFLALKNELNSIGPLLLVGPREEKSWTYPEGTGFRSKRRMGKSSV